VAGKEGELIGEGREGARDIAQWELIGFIEEALREGEDEILEVTDEELALGIEDFGMDASDKADERRGLVMGFGDLCRDGAVEEVTEDLAITGRVTLEEGAGLLGEPWETELVEGKLGVEGRGETEGEEFGIRIGHGFGRNALGYLSSIISQ
jgi:hypothetical protein